jgi:hypothetical protein
MILRNFKITKNKILRALTAQVALKAKKFLFTA